MILLGILCLMLKIGNGLSATWDYSKDDHGPENWHHIYSECAEDKQSPIDFNSEELESDTEMELFMLSYKQVPHNVRVINNGHTVKLEFNTSKPMFMYGGGLSSMYKLAQVHMHWGSKSQLGSEHTVNGEHYPIEFHFVHYKAKHDSLSDSLVDPDHTTLAVLGVFGELSEEDNPKLTPLIENLNLVQENVGEFSEIESFAAEDLLPGNLTRFYRYEGSLTTPACNQIVQWTVNQATIPISESQLNTLRSMQQKNGEQIVDNFRPVQAINGRKILDVTTYSVDSGAEKITGPVLIISAIIYQFL